MSAPDVRLRMAKAIVDFEARRDKAGHLVVYQLPPNDGGGRFEVAGINERFDKPVADRLVALLGAAQWDDAERVAAEYIAANTDPAQALTDIPAIEFYLRDTVFNRGAKGMVRTLQRALGVPDDGVFGPVTDEAMRLAESDPKALLAKLRIAREDYERNVVGYRANFWTGLVNRWNKSLVVAETFSLEPDGTPTYRDWQSLVMGPMEKNPTAAQAEAHPLTPWMDEAQRYVGFHELPDNHGIEQFIKLAHTGSVGDPWCAIFVNACLEAAGVPGSRSAMARSFEHHEHFIRLAGPAYGAIGTMWRGSPSAGTGHVFFYTGENDRGVLGLGGNQNDQVCIQYEDRKRIVAYWWPKSRPWPKTGPIKAAPGSATGGGTEV